MNRSLDGWKRTGYCAEFDESNTGEQVTLMGWVDSRRDLGGLIFVWLRDRSGKIQLVFDGSAGETETFAGAETLRSEFVIAVRGTVKKRSAENVNKALKTGAIEVAVSELKILSTAETPPFEIVEGSNVRDDLRLKYRYLDIRRPDMQRNLMLRSRIAMTARKYLDDNGFLEIETPILQMSTPEGARDYLVPSRVHKGRFYALPQSPQIFKQLLMVSGFDRYFQIARCFRDEDLRADRQPEFTQIDMELSFIEVDDIIKINEGLIKQIFKDALNIDIALPLRRIKYAEAMNRFGSDKPDTRFGMELTDITAVVKDCGFKVFSSMAKPGHSVRGINVKHAGLSRKEIDALGEYVKTYGAKGLAWINMKEDGANSPIAKFLTEDELNAVIKAMGGETGDVLLFVADRNKVVYDSLGALRLHVAKKLGLIDESKFDLLWITEFPQFEYSEEEGRYVAMHHPFTAPMDEDLDKLESAPDQVRAKAYDIVLNGNEIGGGSIRIHDAEIQERMFRALGFSHEEAWKRFGFMMGAFQYGTPPHGGLAYGLDRLAMILGGCDSIRDVIAFPKVQNASDLMTDAPSAVDDVQLRDLGIAVTASGDEE